ncbi:hypothetical protein C8R45DRAFT_937405 [Mycena sanguinolenta]|nr:hypothetical protein C8R45DRAFT_937405 [Mycena sanguinolenta]
MGSVDLQLAGASCTSRPPYTHYKISDGIGTEKPSDKAGRADERQSPLPRFCTKHLSSSKDESSTCKFYEKKVRKYLLVLLPKGPLIVQNENRRISYRPEHSTEISVVTITFSHSLELSGATVGGEENEHLGWRNNLKHHLNTSTSKNWSLFTEHVVLAARKRKTEKARPARVRPSAPVRKPAGTVGKSRGKLKEGAGGEKTGRTDLTAVCSNGCGSGTRNMNLRHIEQHFGRLEELGTRNNQSAASEGGSKVGPESKKRRVTPINHLMG